ncbi:MAG: hypothetical protein V4641_30635 [Pseudomonadota bacterium]
MHIVDCLQRYIYQTPRWKLVGVTLLATLIKTGVWFMPNLDSTALIASNPFVNPFSNPDAHYLLTSWLGLFGAWLLGATSEQRLFCYFLVFTVLFSALFIRLLLTRLPDASARSAVVLFTLLPVSGTAYYWVGIDGITLCLMTLALLQRDRSPFLLLLTGVLLGMQHFEQSLFAFSAILAALLLARYWRAGDATRAEVGGYSLRWVCSLLAGIILGKCVLHLLFQHFGLQLNSGRLYWMRQHLPALIGQTLLHLHLVVWSALGLGWIVLLAWMERGKAAWPLLLALAGLLLLLPVSGDQTRVLAIITLPLLSVHWLLNPDFLDSLNRKFISGLFGLSLVLPWSWAWEGLPRWSALPFDVALLLQRFDVWPATARIWPF